MKTGSILQAPVAQIETTLASVVEQRQAIQSEILAIMEKAAGMDNAIKGYRHALALLQDESNKI